MSELSRSPEELKNLGLPGIKGAELFWVRLPFQNPFRTSFGEVNFQESVLVRIRAEDGLEGWGEAPAGPYPRYSHESSTTAWHILSDFLLPSLVELDPASIEQWEEKRPFIRGHSMARGSILMALMDLCAKHRDVPLFELFGAKENGALAGVSLGIQDTVEDLFSRMKNAVEKGYLRVKLKIKPGTDVSLLQKVRNRFPDLSLMVDGNGGYRPEHHSDLQNLDRFSLLMIEQPFSPPDVLEHANLQEDLETPVCLDESVSDPSIMSLVDRLNACEVINIKAPRLGGPVSALEVYNFCMENGYRVFCGGLLETGIGRAHNVALASLPGFKLPGDISASSRYFPEDIVEPEFDISEDGIISLPDHGTGICVKPKIDFIRDQTKKSGTF